MDTRADVFGIIPLKFVRATNFKSKSSPCSPSEIVAGTETPGGEVGVGEGIYTYIYIYIPNSALSASVVSLVNCWTATVLAIGKDAEQNL